MSAKHGRTDKEMRNINAAFDELEKLRTSTANATEDFYRQERERLRNQTRKSARQERPLYGR
jgi:hypothetical protein